MASEARSNDPVAEAPAELIWRLWVDTGGTFTDCVALDPFGAMHRAKVLSSGGVRAVTGAVDEDGSVELEVDWDLPEDFFRGAQALPLGERSRSSTIVGYRSANKALILDPLALSRVSSREPLEIRTGVEAPVLAAHWVTRTPLSEPLPPATLRLATTRGTNALLERKGAPTALFITAGFGDLLTIGTQQRPDLFALNVVKPPPLYDRAIEVAERLDSSGRMLRPLEVTPLRSEAEAALAAGIRTAAVALLHSYRNPLHEEQLAEFLIDLGFTHVSCSSRLAPLIKIVPRAETAVVNAYLSEVIGEYLETVGAAITPGPLHVLTSAGSLVRSGSYLPKDSLLSGPAGGVVGAAATALQSGWARSLAFDMGGTSTDVSRFDGELDYRFETKVGDARLLSPSLAIETVAAGGGSICAFDGRQLKVGPQSAGADPGPACYGAGGPLTLTDVNLLLGRLRPQSFEIPIDPAAAERAGLALARCVADHRKREPEPEEMLQGLLDIANERMAEAIRRTSIRQGYRPSEFALVAFGGAGGQHACALAEILGIESVLVPEDAGLLSAVGLGRARIERMAERQVLRLLSELGDELPAIFNELTEQAVAALRAEGVQAGDARVERRLAYLRLAGQETSLAIEFDAAESLEDRFSQSYLDHYGYRPEGELIEIETLRVMASSVEEFAAEAAAAAAPRAVESSRSQRVLFGGRWYKVPVFVRESLRPGDRFRGPALVFERHCSTVIHPGWTCEIDGFGCLILRRAPAEGGAVSG